MRKVKLIGITGGVGSGKSQLLRYIKDNNRCEVYFTDDIAKEIRKKGTPAYNAIVSVFGADILNSEGEIMNAVLAARMYSDANLKEALESIVHPKVIAYLVDKCNQAKKENELDFVFIESAILEKTGIIMDSLDEIWYIHADESVRKERLLAGRGYDEIRTKSIMASQPSEKYFYRISDVVIDNSGDLESAYKQIDNELNRLMGMEMEPDDDEDKKETTFVPLEESPLSIQNVRDYVTVNAESITENVPFQDGGENLFTRSMLDVEEFFEWLSNQKDHLRLFKVTCWHNHERREDTFETFVLALDEHDARTMVDKGVWSLGGMKIKGVAEISLLTPQILYSANTEDLE